jgi:hypothetical protein
MARHGLKAATAAKKRRLKEAAQEEADEASALAAQRAKLNETKVNPDDLKGESNRQQRGVGGGGGGDRGMGEAMWRGCSAGDWVC